MPVNTGSLGSTITFSDLQTFYGGSHPISLSEYYRGGAEVPSTALTGANPYTGTTSFSGSGTGSGGSSGIGVAVSNQDTTSGGGTLSLTNVGYNTARGYYTYSWNAPSGGATIDITLRGRQTSGSFNPGVLNTQIGLFTFTRSFTQGRFENGRTNFNVDNITFDRRFRIGSSGGLDATYRYQASVPAGFGLVAIGATLRNEFNPPVTLVSNNSTTASTTVSRRRAVFTNNTGQTIRLTTTFMGGNSRTATLTRGQTIDTGIINGSSEAWTYSYSYQDAGSGSGSSDATVAGIFADVTAQTVTTTNPNASVAFASPSNTGNNISSITIPAGDVDFTMNIGVRSGNASAVFTESSFNTDGLSFAGGTPIRGSTHPRQIGPGRGGFFVFGTTPLTIRVTGNRSSAVTWNAFASSGNGGVTEFGSFSLTNNAQTSTSTVQDISFTNNTGSNVIFSSSSTGGARTLNNGATAQVQDNGASSNWSFAYRYAPSTQPANTAIPASGTTSLNQFNSPGNASP